MGLLLGLNACFENGREFLFRDEISAQAGTGKFQSAPRTLFFEVILTGPEECSEHVGLSGGCGEI